MKIRIPIAFCLLLTISMFLLSCNNKTDVIPYTTGEWDADSLGYHRVVIRVDKKADAAIANINWRRCDKEPEKKGFILVDGTTKSRINNVITLNINNEECKILFQPKTTPGEYYVYYLPGKQVKKSNYPRVIYPGPFNTADSAWSSKYRNYQNDNTIDSKNIVKAKVMSIQSRDQFNSFYPMEVIATRSETEDLIRSYPNKDFLVFTEESSMSIRMNNFLPEKWITDKPSKLLKAKADKGEYFTFQLGVFSPKDDLKNLRISFSGFSGKGGKVIIKPEEITCFNTGGRNWDGSLFQNHIDVKKSTVQALWCGVMIPEQIGKGRLSGSVTVNSDNLKPETVEIQIEVSDKVAENHGDNDPMRMTRLRWLNSDLGFNGELISPFTEIKIENNELSILGRKLKINELGFPQKFLSYFSPDVTSVTETGIEVISEPVSFEIESDVMKDLSWKSRSMVMKKESPATATWRAENSCGSFDLNVDGTLEADGFVQLKIKLIAREDMFLRNTHLYIPVSGKCGSYMMGLGLRGGLRPLRYHWKWDRMLHQEGVWIGTVNGGIQYALRDDKYIRPLNTNFYREKPLIMPDAWYNEGKGGIDIKTSGDNVLIDNYSGSRSIKNGDTLSYYINILLTPFKPINTDEQWATRFYHSYKPIDTVKLYGANTINIHHANEINPWINYPFLEPSKMKSYVDEAHRNGMKVKIYNTIRELSNRAPEIFAIRSLGHEIFSAGPGNGFNWLQEHLYEDYIPAWFVPHLKDAAVINSGMSRWHNYYIEGMNWLTKEIGIDGLYLDDVAFDRTTMKRLRKVLDSNREGALIDLHSANQYNVRDGFTNSAYLYMEHFPYLNRLWFGEYFDRNLSPDFWLIEMSGIPFGLMGEMLQDGGNPYRGMIYGMTSRAPWSGDPSSLWKLWDDFGMSGTLMSGYWSENCPVKTNLHTILATVYRKQGSAMIALASWDKNEQDVKLIIDWQKLGIDRSKCKMIIPAIKNFQEEQLIEPGQNLTIKPAEGKIIILTNKF